MVGTVQNTKDYNKNIQIKLVFTVKELGVMTVGKTRQVNYNQTDYLLSDLHVATCWFTAHSIPPCKTMTEAPSTLNALG